MVEIVLVAQVRAQSKAAGAIQGPRGRCTALASADDAGVEVEKRSCRSRPNRGGRRDAVRVERESDELFAERAGAHVGWRPSSLESWSTRRVLDQFDRDAIRIAQVAGLPALIGPPRDLDRLGVAELDAAAETLEVGIEIIDD